ncbi:MAG: pyruvate:ferredoxin (flavodoxin) oxidoreductase [Bacillota bacterium]
MNTKKLVTMDGNEAAAYIAYNFTDVAAIYPITPSSPMAEKTDAWSAKGKKNFFNQTVNLIEMQSEAGAIGAVHGALETGALATSYTSSQGLMLMIPVMHRIAGERLPGVLHVAARTVGTHALSIFGDHSDVMNCRQTGFALLSTGSVQEVMDLAGVAHLAAIKGRIPFMHFFDGFRTSHEICKIEEMPVAELEKLIDKDALREFRQNSLNPDHPKLHATVQNPDIYFQVREANNRFYNALPDIVEDYMAEISKITGREYHIFNYYGAPDAEEIIIAMGSVSGTVEQVCDHLNAKGRKVGFLQVHLFRPFSFEHFLNAIPTTVKKIAVLDRCKEIGSAGEPLYQDVCTAFINSDRKAKIVGGRYGLSSKDTDPSQIIAVYDNLHLDSPKANFTIGINDDITNLSLPLGPYITTGDEDVISCKFWGLGGDGTVGANKNTVQIINDSTQKYAQAYFEYDAKKSYGVTKSHLRFGNRPIRSAYYVKSADFIACHNQTYMDQYDIVSELRPNGTFLLNCTWSDEDLDEKLSADVRRFIAENNISFYTIDATDIAMKLGLGTHINMVLQSAFFALAKVIPVEEALEYMKDAARKTYGKKGETVVNKNLAAIDEGAVSIHKVTIPESWKTAQAEAVTREDRRPAVVRNILEPINRQKGDDLPVSTFIGYEDGTIDVGLTAYEKRKIAIQIPVWDADKCLQCNQCSFVCPHAVIRPYLLTEEETQKAPAGFITTQAKGAAAKEYQYSMQISVADCTGCGSCVAVCPAKEKAITMIPIDEASENYGEIWEYGLNLSEKGDVFNPFTVKGSQFRQPLVEFSAACAGCGETPYAKLLTQLFGDRAYWANATGCTQAWGSPMPGIPYTTNKKGRGPAWTNSLFENNAEFSLGMLLSVKQQRDAEKARVEKMLTLCGNNKIKTVAEEWLEAFDNFHKSAEISDRFIKVMEEEKSGLSTECAEAIKEILDYKDQLSKKCFWMFGGDGWAYDIGFGGLDHVVAGGEDINIFIVDTEVYSNTGGQSSKATPIGAVAQFCSSGKKSYKKDLGSIFMTYGNVYVAQVAMGANPAQLVKVLKEAEAYPGPSVIVAYTPCGAHGIKRGMCNVQAEMKRAVDSGYWNLYHYNPLEEKPLTVDSKTPELDFHEFLDGEVRYASLKKSFPENAEELFALGEKQAKERYERYKHMEENQ